VQRRTKIIKLNKPGVSYLRPPAVPSEGCMYLYFHNVCLFQNVLLGYTGKEAWHVRRPAWSQAEQDPCQLSYPNQDEHPSSGGLVLGLVIPRLREKGRK
jgi:hypothetical protein